MGLLKKIVAWIAKKLSKEQKAELFDKAVDKWAGEKKERRVVGPYDKMDETFIDHGPSDRIKKRSRKP